MRWGGLLFLSGASALILQTLWVKQLALVVGVDVYAIAIGIAAFFGGLGAGSLVLGRLADRIARPARLFAGLEVAVAVLASVTTWMLAWAPPLFVAIQSWAGPLAWLIPIGLVFLPAFAMGGTYPAVLRILPPDQSMLSRRAGQLYAANTAGAIAGTLLAAFALIPTLGVKGTALAAGAISLSAAMLALAADRKRAARAPKPIKEGFSPRARVGLILYGCAGGVALGYEVIWSQALVQFLSTRTFAFAVVLATYLTGLVLGALIWTRLSDRIADPWRAFGGLIAAAGICAALAFLALGPWLLELQSLAGNAVYALTEDRLARMSARFAVAAAVLILPTTILLGAAFPAAMRLIASARRVGADSGAVAGWNIVGGIAGSLVTGFVLIPVIGVMKSLAVLALLAAVLGGVAILVPDHRDLRRQVSAAGLVLVSAGLLIALPADKLGRLLETQRGGQLVAYEESAAGIVAVLEQAGGGGSFRRLYIQGVSNSGDAMPSQRYMRLQALLPLLIHNGEPERALVIGLGTGITCGSLTAFPLEERVCAELVPAVVRAVGRFDGNFGVGATADVDLVMRDGRHFLLATDRQFDLITLEPPPPSARGVVNLYSTEFYQLARARLRPGGLVAQWWPIATQNIEESQELVRSMLDVFPHVSVWTTEVHEMMVIGSMEPVRLDAPTIARRFEAGSVRAALEAVGVESAADLMATYVMDERALTAFAGDARAVTDNWPRIEYAPWVRPREVTRVLPRLLDAAEPPPLIDASPDFIAATQAEREELYTFYASALSAYAGDRRGWAVRLRQVSARDPDNAYYRWFTGEADR